MHLQSVASRYAQYKSQSGGRVLDALKVSGFVVMDARGRVIEIVPNQKAVWAKTCTDDTLDFLYKCDTR
jgi:hypothetical protein